MSASAQVGRFRALRFAGIVALAGFGVAAFLVAGSYLFWQSEKKLDESSKRSLQDARNRLEAIKRERDDLQGSEETYRALIAGGAFVPEHRLDLIEAMNALKQRHQLLALEYEILPQRPLKFASGATYSAVLVNASRVRIKAEAYHDGDLVAFLDEFPRLGRGFFPIDQCVLRRSLESSRVAAQPPDDGDKPRSPAAVAPAASAATPAAVKSAVSAECTLEWITLGDKQAPPPVRPGGASNPKAPA